MTNHNNQVDTKLSSIMEVMMARVCKLVDDDLSGLRSELTRVLLDNAKLTEKVIILECELGVLRKRSCDNIKPAKHFRTVGVQTGDTLKDDHRVDGPAPTIEGIYGKDWCMNLWKDADNLQVTTRSSAETQPVEQPSEVIGIKQEFKEEDCEVEIAAGCQKACTSRRADDQLGAPVGLPGESSRNDGATEEHSPHVIPVDEDDPANTQFIRNSKGGQSSCTVVGATAQNQPQSLAVYSENNNGDLSRETCSTYNTVHLQTTNNTDKDQLTCKICDKTFIHKRKLTHHMKTHKVTVCQICGQSKRDKTHKCNIPQPVSSQESNTTCRLCGVTFGKASALKIHSRVHTGKGAHVCRTCGKGFSQKGNLQKHLSIHTGEKPFHCGYCGRTFKQVTSLNYHLLTHEKNSRRSKRLKK